MDDARNAIHTLRQDNQTSIDVMLCYCDRPSNHNFDIRLRDVVLDPEDELFFKFIDQNGIKHNLPFHRIKSIYSAGTLVWRRRELIIH